MTVFLVLATAIAIVLIDTYVGQRRKRIARLAEQAVSFLTTSTQPPSDAFLHPGHTWIRIHHDDLATVGASAFASSFAGKLSAVDLPKEGRRLKQAEPACTLVSDGREGRGSRRLELVMPVDGKVLAVNRKLLADPALTQQRPYDEGWLLRIRPRRLEQTLRNLLPAEAARGWLDASRARIAARLEPAVGAAWSDGGELDPAFGDRIEEEAWQALRKELFPAPSDGASRSASSGASRERA